MDKKFEYTEEEIINESFYSNGRPYGVVPMIEGKLERYYPVSRKSADGWCLILS